MRSNQVVRSLIQRQLEQAAEEIRARQLAYQADDEELAFVRANLTCFEHKTSNANLSVAGVDGSGDFPLLDFMDTFVYLTIAQATLYQSDPTSGLREVRELEPVANIACLVEDARRGPELFEQSLTAIASLEIRDVIDLSDYRRLKQAVLGRNLSVDALFRGLIRPHASDVGNIGIQLRSTAEFAAALRVIEASQAPSYVLMDTTLSLPLLSSSSSLFYEHLKRLCCVKARARGVGFFTLSKSHGLPGMDQLEMMAADIQGLSAGHHAEHWYLRIPTQQQDGFTLGFTKDKVVPPVGAVSYLVRFHRNTPVMRLDMDAGYFSDQVQGRTTAETQAKETKIFEDLDFIGHDLRAYGYPFPIKAAHDRASLTSAERLDYKRQAIATLAKQGINPKVFRDVSMATRHR